MGETVDIKRFTEWLGTVEGLVKAGIGVIAAVALIYTKTSKSLDPIVEHFNLPGGLATPLLA